MSPDFTPIEPLPADPRKLNNRYPIPLSFTVKSIETNTNAMRKNASMSTNNFTLTIHNHTNYTIRGCYWVIFFQGLFVYNTQLSTKYLPIDTIEPFSTEEYSFWINVMSDAENQWSGVIKLRTLDIDPIPPKDLFQRDQWFIIPWYTYTQHVGGPIVEE